MSNKEATARIKINNKLLEAEGYVSLNHFAPYSNARLKRRESHLFKCYTYLSVICKER